MTTTANVHALVSNLSIPSKRCFSNSKIYIIQYYTINISSLYNKKIYKYNSNFKYREISPRPRLNSEHVHYFSIKKKPLNMGESK